MAKKHTKVVRPPHEKVVKPPHGKVVRPDQVFKKPVQKTERPKHKS